MTVAMMTREDLAKYFTVPEKEVAKELGICLTSLKKMCRSNGITRWPYRKMKSLAKAQRGKERLQTAHLANHDDSRSTLGRGISITKSHGREDVDTNMIDSDLEIVSNASFDGDGSERSKASTPSSPRQSAFKSVLTPRPRSLLKLPKLLPAISASGALIYAPRSAAFTGSGQGQAAPFSGVLVQTPAASEKGVHKSTAADKHTSSLDKVLRPKCVRVARHRNVQISNTSTPTRPSSPEHSNCGSGDDDDAAPPSILSLSSSTSSVVESPCSSPGGASSSHDNILASAYAGCGNNGGGGGGGAFAIAGMSDEDLIALLAGCAKGPNDESSPPPEETTYHVCAYAAAAAAAAAAEDVDCFCRGAVGGGDDSEIVLALASCSGSHLDGLAGSIGTAAAPAAGGTGANAQEALMPAAAAVGEAGCGPEGAVELEEEWQVLFDAGAAVGDSDWSLAHPGFSLC